MRTNKIPDVALVLACVLALAHMGVQRYRMTVGMKSPTAYKAGSTIKDTADLELEKARRTLLIATASSCHFCTASMPFYRRLVPAADKAGVRVIGVTTEDPAVNQRYLASHSVLIPEVTSGITNHINIYSTPMLVLVRSDGTVIGSWLGLLNERQQDDVLAAIWKEHE